MELKDYQSRTLEAFERWRDALAEARQDYSKRADVLAREGLAVSDADRNYPKTAWEKLAQTGDLPQSAGTYVDRTADAGFPIPHVCLKVPTGGGKTLLAAAALERLGRQSGLTLWITPTRAIYQQTKDTLWNREHPYRQMLERASGGRVKLLEKDDPFSAADVANYQCVMLLMLPAANRQKGKEFLRMFRDSGRYPTLFPDSDDALGDGRLLERFPDLERTSERGPVKHSLFNVFKMLRPVVVLDEAHKAYGTQLKANREFVRSVNRLDPRLVIELSATPNRNISNLLVDISGVDLKAEEMIKLPVQVTSFTNAEWQYTLGEAYAELDRLENEAASLSHSEGRYIRPIAVVRVERTGKDQRDGERVHAEDARDFLTRQLGVPSEQVRVKSSEVDELGREDLRSESSPVRWIVTKDALKEGWDCPFAYLLVLLDGTRAATAITQLVGRVMRQPDTRRTGRAPLDQCHVFCWNVNVSKAVEQVKRGLEQEGLTGLDNQVRSEDPIASLITVRRREQFRGHDIFLPTVLHRDGDGEREFSYQRHILPRIDWGGIRPPDTQSSQPDPAKVSTASVDVGEARADFHDPVALQIDKTPRTSYFARRLSDIVPNPWQAARMVDELLRTLRDAGEADAEIYDRRSNLAVQLREHVAAEIERQSERVFRGMLRTGEIRFDLRAGRNFCVAESFLLDVSDDDRWLPRSSDKRPLQLNLFVPVYERHFDSGLERAFAQYLDEQQALLWWHRVAARQQREYYLRGWRRDRIYPDFVAMSCGPSNSRQLLLFETKGKHLRNPDTEYKRRVFDALEGAFNASLNAGTMTVTDGPARGVFRLLFNENEFATALASLNEASAS